MRNSKGQFVKGSKPVNGFKKGVVPKTAFKKGLIPWNKSSFVHTLTCKTCLKLFTKPPEISVVRFKKRIYCSRKCQALDKERKEKFKLLMSHPFSEDRKAKHKLAFKRGEESHRWIKDRTKLKESWDKHLDTKYKYWMLEVKKRDIWKCRLLSNDCSGRLQSHHIFNWIDYPELRYVINNGITLCAVHHPRGREEEKRMIPIFQELLSVSKV